MKTPFMSISIIGISMKNAWRIAWVEDISWVRFVSTQYTTLFITMNVISSDLILWMPNVVKLVGCTKCQSLNILQDIALSSFCSIGRIKSTHQRRAKREDQNYFYSNNRRWRGTQRDPLLAIDIKKHRGKLLCVKELYCKE